MLVVKIETMTSSVIIPKQTEVESAVRGWIDDCVWRQEIKRAETGGLDFFEPNEIETMGRDEAHQLDGLLRYASNLFAPQEKAAIARALTGNEPSERHRSIIAGAAQRIGMSADPNTVAGRLVERTILRSYATLLDELGQPIIDVPKVPSAAPRVAQPASFIFTSYWASFKQYKLDNREWKADTAENAEGTKNIFDRLVPGATTAQFVSAPVASDFKSKLMLLPRNYAQGDQKKKSAEKLIALGRTLGTKDKVQDATVNKHLNNLSEYWSYLVTQKKIPADIQNPFEGLHIPLKKGRKARNERHNWTPALEKELFESPPLSRLRLNSSARHSRQPDFPRCAVLEPLLGRTMGTRENEVCDALVGDIKLEETNGDPIWYLEIIDGKDSGSERRVPFADLVLGIGFLEQRVIGRDPDQPLFPS